MRCIQSASREGEQGSAVTGFALVAPLVVLVFVAVAQVISVALVRTAAHSAAATGARLAATLGSGATAGNRAADAVLRDLGVDPDQATKTWRRSRISGVPYLALTVTVPARVPFVGRGVSVSSSVRVTDENAL